MKELIERLRLITKKLRLTPMPIADVIPALQDSANALERMEADNTELQAALDGAKLFEQSHKHALTVIERLTAELNSIKEKNAPEIVRINAYITELTAENAKMREGLDGWHSRFLDCEVERDVEKEHVRQCVANIAKLVAESAALRADAERYRFIFAESGRVDPVCAVVWKKGNVRNSSEWVNSVGGEWLSKELDAAIGEKT